MTNKELFDKFREQSSKINLSQSVYVKAVSITSDGEIGKVWFFPLTEIEVGANGEIYLSMIYDDPWKQS